MTVAHVDCVSLKSSGNEAEMASGRHFFECLNRNIQTLKPTPVVGSPCETSLSDCMNINSFSILSVPYLVPSLLQGLKVWLKLSFFLKSEESGVSLYFYLWGKLTSNRLVLSS